MEGRRSEVGQRIKRERRRAGFRSQGAFAAAIGVHEASVANAERGSDRIGEAVYSAIENGLRWPEGSILDYLRGHTDEPPQAKAPRADDAKPWMPVLTDAQIMTMNGFDIGMHYIKLEREYGEEAADDWVVKAAIVRRDARRAAGKTLATDES